VKAYNGGDAKAVAALYAEDALLLPPGASGVSGRLIAPPAPSAPPASKK
jgi:ketosteroid isomerase-like protein